MADNTKETAVKITGDGSSAVAALKDTAEAVNKSFGDMQGVLGKMGSAFEKVSGVFTGFTTVLAGAGLAAIQQMVDAFADSVEGTRDLARSLGITTNEVAGLQAALDDVGATTGEYEGMAKALQRQLRTNEDGMKALGLQTRDQSGNLRPLNDLMMDSIQVLNEYKEGTDRNIASQELFGRAASGSSRIMLLTKEVMEANQQAAEELGLVVGGNATAAWSEYDSASDRAGLTMKAFGRAVGETVMPAVTTLMNYFNSVAPAAIMVLRGALGGLTTAFLGLVNGVRLVWEVINAMVFSVAEPIMALGRALMVVVNGDFKQAGEELKAIPSNIGDAWGRAYDNMVASSEDTATKIKRLWSATAGDVGGVGDSGAAKGTKSATVKGGDPKEAKLTSRMQEWEAALAERKIAYQKENDLREMSLQDEMAYWQQLAGMADVNSKEKIELRKRLSSAEIAMLKEQRTRELALNEESIAAYKDQRMAVLEATRQEAEFKVATLQMTNEELIGLDQQLEQQRYQITKEAIQERLALLANDPTKNAVALQKLNDELAMVEQQHQLKQRGLQLDMFKEQSKDWQGFFNNIGQSFGSVVGGLVTGTMTWGQAVKGLFSSLLSSIAGFIGQIIAKKVAAFAVEKGLALMGIGLDATKAATGAAASQAAIPVVGPGLALAAMAAVFAAVMGMGKRASARGGYDIPSGVNPVTQLHEEEMVLPKEQANAVRDMANGGGGSPILINTTGGDFVHKNDLAALMKKLNRNFAFVS
jgi:hypothetical protein